MAFIGNTNTTQAFTPAVDYFSGTGSATAFTLSRPVASVAQVQVTIDNVAQNPSSAFTVSSNTITFTSAPLSGTNNIYVYYTSPITDVIAPGQGTVTATSFVSSTGTGAGVFQTSPTITTPVISSIVNTGTLTLPTLTGTVSLTTRTVQVFTSSSGTYTTPTGCKSLYIKMVGGGGGGGGVTGNNGSVGGNTTFGTATAGGGSAGQYAGAGGQGGTATNSYSGVALSGGDGGTSVQAALFAGTGTNMAAGGGGGNSAFGGGGSGAYPSTAAFAGKTNTGGGGGGGAYYSTGSVVASASGGGAGGYVEAYITSPSATYSYAVGSGGAAGAAGTGGSAGGAGGSGVIIVTEFY